MTPARRAHVERVVALLDTWAEARAVTAGERSRWRCAGWLHDALKDAPADQLRPWLDAEFRAMPPALWHGPAAAARAASEGMTDPAILAAVRYHTVGCVDWEATGMMLLCADYLEPGRQVPDRAALVARVATSPDVRPVAGDILRARLRGRDPALLHPRTIAWLRTLAP